MESSSESENVAKNIWLIGSPLVFVFGLVGNLLVILVYLRNQKTSSTTYLTYLAIFDLLTIAMMSPRWWIIYMFGYDIRHTNDFVCKFGVFSVQWTARCSNWCMVFVTIERVICTVRARPIHTLCTPRLAMWLLTVSTVFLAVFYSHNFYGYAVVETKVYQTDRPAANDQNNHVTTATGAMLNFSDINDGMNASVSSTTDIMQPWNTSFSTAPAVDDFKLTTMSYGSGPPVTTNQPFVVSKSCVRRPDLPGYKAFEEIMDTISVYGLVLGANLALLVGTIVIIRKLTIVKSMLTSAMSQGASAVKSDVSTTRKRASQTTITVLVVNVFLFVFHTPIYIFYLLRTTFIDPATGMTPTQEIVWAVLSLMYNINYAINFYLYMVMGSRFRQQCKELILCSKSGLYNAKKSLSM